MSTSVEHRPSCSRANASSNRLSDNDACSTSNKPLSINPTDEPNPPLSHSPLCLKSFDDGHRIDSKTNQLASRIGLHPDPRSLVAGQESVWINNEGDGTVQRIDGKSGDV